MTKLFTLPKVLALDTNVAVEALAELNFYEAGTTTPLDTYTDSALSVAHANPAIADANGQFAPIYLQAASYKVDLTAASAGASLPGYPVDNIDGSGGDASALTYTPPWTAASPRLISSRIAEVPSLADFDVDRTGSVSAIPAWNRAYASGEPNIRIPWGAYLMDTATSGSVVPVAGVNMYGTSSGKIVQSVVLNHTGDDHMFNTDDTDREFTGLGFANVRVIGGVTGKLAFQSHYPYTWMKNVHIENTSGRYNGNGIRLHNDSATSGMGGWGSLVDSCKVVLDNDAINPRTSLELDINGGNVQVKNFEAILAETAVYVKKGENIIIDGINTNDIQDQTSTDGNIQKAAIVVGLAGPTLGVQGCQIKGMYIEAHARAILVRGADNTLIEGGFVNDLGFYNPPFSIPYGQIHVTSDASNTVARDFELTLNKSLGYPFYVEAPGVQNVGLSIENVRAWLNRGSDGYFANQTLVNDDTLTASIKNTMYKATVSSSTTYEKDLYANMVLGIKQNPTRSDISAAASGVAEDLFTIAAGETWDVVSTQYDDDTRYTKATVHRPGDGSAAGIDVIVAGTLNALSLSTNDVQVTQTTGGPERIVSSWLRTG